MAVDYNKYSNPIGNTESGGSGGYAAYHNQNGYKVRGKHQFVWSTPKGSRWKGWGKKITKFGRENGYIVRNEDDFTRNAALQEEWFAFYINNYALPEINSIKHLNKAGLSQEQLVAGYHVGGIDNLTDALVNNDFTRFRDGNGVTMAQYIERTTGSSAGGSSNQQQSFESNLPHFYQDRLEKEMAKPIYTSDIGDIEETLKQKVAVSAPSSSQKDYEVFQSMISPVLNREYDDGGLVRIDEYQDGGEVWDEIEQLYPRLSSMRENTDLVKDRKFKRKKTGAGDIEYMDKNTNTIDYGNYSYTKPNSDKAAVIYNPRKNDAQSIALDLLHGLAQEDNEYAKLRSEFSKAYINYDQRAFDRDLKEAQQHPKFKEWYGDADGFHDKTWIDGQIRGMLFEGSKRDFKKARYWEDAKEFYKKDPEIKRTFENLQNYLKTSNKFRLEEGGSIPQYQIGKYLRYPFKKAENFVKNSMGEDFNKERFDFVNRGIDYVDENTEDIIDYGHLTPSGETGTGDISDAMRHSLMSTYLAKEKGQFKSWLYGTGHEIASLSDYRNDLSNNKAGRQAVRNIGKDATDEQYYQEMIRLLNEGKVKPKYPRESYMNNTISGGMTPIQPTQYRDGGWYDPQGLRRNTGAGTVPTPNGQISMTNNDGSPLPFDALGIQGDNIQYMQSGGEYQFNSGDVYEIPLYQEGGRKETPYDTWMRVNKGIPWSEAKKQGLTDGTAASNLNLQKELWAKEQSKQSSGTSSGTSLHKIKEGESLSSIAKQYGTTYQDLARINNIPEDKVDLIITGEKLKISDSSPSVINKPSNEDDLVRVDIDEPTPVVSDSTPTEQTVVTKDDNSSKKNITKIIPSQDKPIPLDFEKGCLGITDCAKYQGNAYDQSPNTETNREKNGLYGNAWTRTWKSINEINEKTGEPFGGEMIYDFFSDNEFPALDKLQNEIMAKSNHQYDATGVRTGIGDYKKRVDKEIKNIIDNYEINLESYEPLQGDQIAMFYPNSKHHFEAFSEAYLPNKGANKDFNAFNTHIGTITYEGKVPYIEHTVGETRRKDKLSKVLDGTINDIKIAQIARPKYLADEYTYKKAQFQEEFREKNENINKIKKEKINNYLINEGYDDGVGLNKISNYLYDNKMMIGDLEKKAEEYDKKFKFKMDEEDIKEIVHPNAFQANIPFSESTNYPINVFDDRIIQEANPFEQQNWTQYQEGGIVKFEIGGTGDNGFVFDPPIVPLPENDSNVQYQIEKPVENITQGSVQPIPLTSEGVIAPEEYVVRLGDTPASGNLLRSSEKAVFGENSRARGVVDDINSMLKSEQYNEMSSDEKKLIAGTVFALAGQEGSWGDNWKTRGIARTKVLDGSKDLYGNLVASHIPEWLSDSNLVNKIERRFDKDITDSDVSKGVYQTQMSLYDKLGIDTEGKDIYNSTDATDLAIQLVNKYNQELLSGESAEDYKKLNMTDKVGLMMFIHNRGLGNDKAVKEKKGIPYTAKGGLENIVQRMRENNLYNEGVHRALYLDYGNSEEGELLKQHNAYSVKKQQEEQKKKQEAQERFNSVSQNLVRIY